MASIQPSDFSDFCDFIARIRDAGTEGLTPEQSVEQFRRDQEKLRLWNERNAIAAEQTRRGEYGPLDVEAILSRVEQRLEHRGLAE